jgi:ribonuclease HII
MNIQKKLAEIIPPNQTQYRHEFYNSPIIDALTDSEKLEIEDGLIDMLYATPNDLLIIDTLDYMKSTKVLPTLINSLEKSNNHFEQIKIASYIFKIDRDSKMIDIAINTFKKVKDKWDLIDCFYYLGQFKSDQINTIIEKYISHPEYLVAYNAKRALGLVE